MARKRISTSLNRRLNFEELEGRRLLSATVNVASRAIVTGEPAGSTTNYDDFAPQAISAEGRYVVFLSSAANIVEGFTLLPAVDNIYRLDRLTGEVALVSVSEDGLGGANNGSYQPQISADGNVVAFVSYASNLHSGDNNSTYDVFARDISAGITHLVSIDELGVHSGNMQSWHPSLSADGTVVAFSSRSSNLDPLDSDLTWDIYARHLGLQRTQLVSVNATGTGTGNEDNFGISHSKLSADGGMVVYSSTATNLHPLDTDDEEDVFARDLTTGVTYLVSTNQSGMGSGDGRSWNADVSADGKMIAFMSDASDLDTRDQDIGRRERDTDIFVRNLASGVTQLVSIDLNGNDSGKSESSDPVISADGTVVAFESSANNLVTLTVDSHNIYARNLVTGVTQLVSINAEGTGSGEHEGSFRPVISADGRVVAFWSNDHSLHPLDTDDDEDVYARDMLTGTTFLLSIDSNGMANGDGDSHDPMISADGRHVVFTSEASNLVEGDVNEAEDVFVASIALAPQLPGDYNEDGIVNAGDYTVWRNASGQTGLTPFRGADGNGDGRVTMLDYGVWKSHYGEMIAQGAGMDPGQALPDGETVAKASTAMSQAPSGSRLAMRQAEPESFVDLPTIDATDVIASTGSVMRDVAIKMQFPSLNSVDSRKEKKLSAARPLPTKHLVERDAAALALLDLHCDCDPFDAASDADITSVSKRMDARPETDIESVDAALALLAVAI